jgi:hypothetical protein
LVALNRPIIVIPVLVGKAKMPAAHSLPASIRGLVDRNGVTVSDDKFKRGFEELAQRIETSLSQAPAIEEASLQSERARVQDLIRTDIERHRTGMRQRVWTMLLSLAALVIIGVALWIVTLFAPAGRSTVDRPSFGRRDIDPTKFEIPHPSDNPLWARHFEGINP